MKIILEALGKANWTWQMRFPHLCGHKPDAKLRPQKIDGLSWSLWLTVGTALFALVQVWPCGIYPFELIQAFSFQTLLLSVGILGLTLFRRWWYLSVCCLLICMSMVGKLYPYTASNTSDSKTVAFRIGVFNVYHDNEEKGDAMDALRQSGSEFLAVLEVSIELDSLLMDGLSPSHPFSVSVPHVECCYGMAFYSKLPIVEDSVYYWTQDPVIRARVVSSGTEVDVWSVHTRPPIFPNDTEERNYLMEKVAEEIKTIGKPALLAGDLNIVPWAEDFKQMKTTSGMNDSRRGFLATYPMELGIPLIPIDHIMHTEHFTTAFCKTEVIPGSDHKALVAGLNWK